MNKTLIAALLGSCMMISTPAFATNPNDGDQPPGCAPSGNTPPKCDTNNGGDGGAGGAGGTGIGVGVGIGTGIANSESNAEANATAIAQQSQTQGQAQSLNNENNISNVANGGSASAQGGNASAQGGAANSGGNVLSNVTNYKRAHRVAPAAVAPTVFAGQCQKTTSVGLSTPFGGIGFGGSRTDIECVRERFANWFAQYGRVDVACQIMAQNKMVNRAIRAAGVGCPAYSGTEVIAVPEIKSESPVRYPTGERGR